MSNRVIIFDTTLRDGEQSPGATMNLQEKLRMARQLESLGVDVIEAGFPASSVGDFEAVHAIANAVTDVQVAALARCNKNDIDRAWQALNGARNPRIHVFLATSPIHMEYKLRKTPDQVVEMAVAAVVIQAGEEEMRRAGFGAGPIDATFNVISQIVSRAPDLEQFSINAITGGTDAQGEVTVRLREGEYSATGRGSDPDIIVASAKAYIDALNRLDHKERDALRTQEATGEPAINTCN